MCDSLIKFDAKRHKDQRELHAGNESDIFWEKKQYLQINVVSSVRRLSCGDFSHLFLGFSQKFYCFLRHHKERFYGTYHK